MLSECFRVKKKPRARWGKGLSRGTKAFRRAGRWERIYGAEIYGSETYGAETPSSETYRSFRWEHGAAPRSFATPFVQSNLPSQRLQSGHSPTPLLGGEGEGAAERGKEVTKTLTLRPHREKSGSG